MNLFITKVILFLNLITGFFVINIYGEAVETLNGFVAQTAEETIESYEVINGELNLQVADSTNGYYITKWYSLFPLHSNIKTGDDLSPARLRGDPNKQDLYLYSNLILNGNISGSENLNIYGKSDNDGFQQRKFYFNGYELFSYDEHILSLVHINMYLSDDLEINGRTGNYCDSYHSLDYYNKIKLDSTSVLDLQGHQLILNENTNIKGGGAIVNGDILLNGGCLFDVTLKNVNLILTQDYVQLTDLNLKGDVHIKGNGHLFILDGGSITINNNSTLRIDNTKFILNYILFDGTIKSSELYFNDYSSILYLDKNTVFQVNYDTTLGQDSEENARGANIIIGDHVKFEPYKIQATLDNISFYDDGVSKVIKGLTFIVTDYSDYSADPSISTLNQRLAYIIVNGTIEYKEKDGTITSSPIWGYLCNAVIDGDNTISSDFDIYYNDGHAYENIKSSFSLIDILKTESIANTLKLNSNVNLYLLSGATLDIVYGTLKYSEAK